jgi:hypothetical protein
VDTGVRVVNVHCAGEAIHCTVLEIAVPYLHSHGIVEVACEINLEGISLGLHPGGFSLVHHLKAAVKAASISTSNTIGARTYRRLRSHR